MLVRGGGRGEIERVEGLQSENGEGREYHGFKRER